MREQPPLLAPIFRSDGQARLLSALLLTGDELSIREVSDRAGLAYGTAHGEITRLLSAGILRERKVGQARLISQNVDSPLVRPIRDILLVAGGPVALLADGLGAIEGIRRAFLYGSFAARSQNVDGAAPNDIDLMVIGDPDPAAVYEVCRGIERSVGRPINPTILTEAEFAEDSGFLQSVRSHPTVAIIGEAP
jgi:DNA-binding transcriptional ArsR family regulator